MEYDYVLTRRSPGGNGAAAEQPLVVGRTLRLGRAADCDVRIVDDTTVSREHATIGFASGAWYVADGNSRNGTYVNGKRIAGRAVLKPGDIVSLGPTGPAFSFERRMAGEQQQVRRTPAEDRGTELSDILPFLAHDRSRVMSSAYMIPGLVTIGTVIALFIVMTLQQSALSGMVSGGNNDAVQAAFAASKAYATAFNDILGLYLIAAAFYLVVRVSGRMVPWRLIAMAAIVTIVFMQHPIFDMISAFFASFVGGVPDLRREPFSLLLFPRVFVSVGLVEELVKAIPVFLGLWIAARYRTAGIRGIRGIRDPLDAIVIGAASASAFTLIETLTLYVPGEFTQLFNAFGNSLTGVGFGQLFALELLVPRIVGEIAGHVAWSGYFAYAIALAAAKPEHRWQLFFGGWAVAAGAHGLWDTFGTIKPPILGDLFQLVIGAASFVLLLATIGRARRVTGVSVPLVAPAQA